MLGCSDSRVPAELVFDQGFGDLFVIRVAGNIVAPSQVGSVEFAAAKFGTRLVVVVGHSQCGAITATLDELLGRSTTESRNLRSIVDRVRPSVETCSLADNRRRLRCARARRRSRECPRVGGSSSPRFRAARTADAGGRAAGCRRGILARNRHRRHSSTASTTSTYWTGPA